MKSVSPEAPTSNRGLVNGICFFEEEAERLGEEVVEAEQETAALHSTLFSTEARTHKVVAAAASWQDELEQLNAEAAELWKVHELPLQEQEQSLRVAMSVISELSHCEEQRSIFASCLHLECQELESVGASLRSEVRERREAHGALSSYLGKAEDAVHVLAGRCNEGDKRTQVLQGQADAEHDRVRLSEAEVEAHRKQVEEIWHELGEMERHCTGSIEAWWREQSGSCEAMEMESEVLQQELRHAQDALEVQAQESQMWREQAYRSEAGIRALQGEDVVGGLRLLGEQCAAYAGRE